MKLYSKNIKTINKEQIYKRINKIYNFNIDNKQKELVNLCYEAALELSLYYYSI